MPSPVTAEIGVHAVELVRRDVALGADDDPGPLEQVGLVVTELAQQDVELVLGRQRRRLREVEQDAEHPRALDVAQEVVSEASTLGGALDETRGCRP